METIEMPKNTGGSWGLNDEVVRLMIKRIIPATVIDFGCGLGKYGKMCREVLGDGVNIIGVDKFKKTCDWLEGEKIYNNIFNQDILEFEGGDADLAIFGDVIEHLRGVDWNFLFKKIISSKKYKYVILVFPIGECNQGEMGGNKDEVHQSVIHESIVDYLAQLGYRIREKHLMIADGPNGDYPKMALLLKL